MDDTFIMAQAYSKGMPALEEGAQEGGQATCMRSWRWNN
jgi:hypothetical protein